MKKIMRLVIMLTVVLLVGIKGVKADTVNIKQQFIDNVWSFHYRNGSVWTFGNLPYNYANGKLVYCIQPDARIATGTYYKYDDFELSGYSNDTKEQMKLISYYGYNYDGHQTLKYYMATQELLWLLSPDERIKWTTGNTDDTPEIDISSEKAEIQRLISLKDAYPTFKGKDYEMEVGSELVLNDTNRLLGRYSIGTNSDIDVSLENDGRIVIRSDTPGEHIINFNTKRFYDADTYIYDNFSTRTQTLAHFGNIEPRNFSIKVTVNPKGKININKTDEDNNSLDGVEFEVYNEQDELVDTMVTEKGKATSKELSLGKYYVKESKELYGYEKDDTKYEIDLVKDNSNEKIMYSDLDIINKKILCEITYITTSYDHNIDAKFNIYTKDGTLIYTGKTVNGIISIKLPYGDYIIKEIEVPNGYKLNDKEIRFSVNDITCASTLKVNNEKVIMPVTSTENNIGYLLIVLFDLGGLIFAKKNN